jgi:ABC-type cobalamin/Fe3+-siderophores transport system ATPase subunit
MDPTTLAIPAGAWLWKNYGKTIANKTASAIKSQWDKLKWDTAAERYRAKIKRLYATTEIMGMGKPVLLDDIFTDVYMLDKPTAFGRYDIEHLKQVSADPEAPPQNAHRINGLQLVVEKDNLFILGKPGAGKTTFLKYIAVKAAEKIIAIKSTEERIDKVPIFISVKAWADSNLELLPFMAQRFEICDFPAAQPFVEELLKSGSAIVLFDGLDEVSETSGQRDRQTLAMSSFVEKYDQAQCLITCRIAASDYSFQPFTYVEIADFTEKEIQKFVGNWFREDKTNRDNFLAEFAKDDNQGLRDLARTPLLLTLLCIAFNETLTFPRRRVELYEEALEALLKKWDSSRRVKRDEVYRKLSLGHKDNMLARIAAETFERNEYFIPQLKLERLITDYVKNVPPHDTNEATDGEAILKAIEAQHGILVERARRVYSFSHLTFQQYFTAKHIVANATEDILTNLVKAYCADGRWREVFLLMTSLLPDASQFMMTFRRGVDELLRGDEEGLPVNSENERWIVEESLEAYERLRALLAWACEKLTSAPADPWLVRSSYLYTELYYPRLNFALVDALNLARALAHDRALAVDLARPLDCALALARDLGLNELAKELAALSLPNDKTTVAERQEFASKLRGLIEPVDIGVEWNLTATHEARLADYLNATGLLQDCLELAVMSPDEKNAMLNSLYLPPAQAGEKQYA